MSAMEDGWKRIVRRLQDEKSDATYKAYASLTAETEDLGNVEVNTWVSPSDISLFGGLAPKNFEYVAGSLKYIGEKPIRVTFESINSITVGGAGNDASAEITNGVNGVPCISGIMPASSAFGGIIPLHTSCVFEIETGDVLDSFVRQTSEAGGANITILKGVYHCRLVDTI